MKHTARMGGRGLAVFTFAVAWAILWPHPWARLIAFVAAPVMDWATPWLQNVQMELRDHLFVISGTLVFDGVLVNRQPMPAIPGSWRQSSHIYIAALVVALTASMIPSGGWRRRIVAAPVALSLALLIASISIVTEVQRAALQYVGSGALSHLLLADHPHNHDLLTSLEARLSILQAICAFFNAGGRLGLSLLAGLASALVAQRMISDGPGPTHVPSAP